VWPSLFSQWLNPLASYEKKRLTLFEKVDNPDLSDYLLNTSFVEDLTMADADIVALDFETTGLDPLKDKILSIGLVNISDSQIDLGSSYHQHIRNKSLGAKETIVIHQITEQQQISGLPLKEALPIILEKLAGKILLAHYAKFDMTLLKRAVKQCYGVDLPILAMDTMILGQQHFDKIQRPYQPKDLRLNALREFHGLPEHLGHNALNDAVATAELYLAQACKRDPDTPIAKLINTY